MSEQTGSIFKESLTVDEPKLDDDKIILELASLPQLEYERKREGAAKKLGIARVSVLDKLVKQSRPDQDIDSCESELKNGINEWDEPVSGQEIAKTILDTFNRHLILPEGGAVSLVLWTIGSYCINSFRIFPKLCLSSPEKRCGKTTTMEVLGAMTHRTLSASNVSAATLFRSIDCWQPSILIDEGDTFIDGNEEVRGIVNSGHTKSGAYVLRCVGDDHEPKQFSTWAPMAIGMIKTPPDTIQDRSVMVTLRRKMVSESVVKMPVDINNELKNDRRKIKRWANDNTEALKLSDPDTPKVGNDRAEDNWFPLLAIADLLGGEWPNLARQAMADLCKKDGDYDESIGPMILSDIRDLFESKYSEESIYSSSLVEKLIELEERPWCEWKAGRPMTQNSLAKMLGPYNIKSKNVRAGAYGSPKKGYTKGCFIDAFSRYLQPLNGDDLDNVLTPSKKALQGATTLQSSNDGGSHVAVSSYVAVQSATQENVINPIVAVQSATDDKALHKTLHATPAITVSVENCSGVAVFEGEPKDDDERVSFKL